MAARHQDDIITSDIDKNLQEQKMSPCDKVGCSTPDSVGGVGSQRNKNTDIQFVYYEALYIVCLDWAVCFVMP